MDRTPVDSSNIDSIGYESVTQKLEIGFSNGEVYQYSDVPEDVYANLMSAESKGRYFYIHIKDIYSYTRIKL